MGQAADEGKLLLNSAFPPRWVRWRLTLTCPPPSLPPFSVSFSPLVPLPPALGHKSVVVYENLQHSHTSLRRGPGSYWPQLVTWRGAMNMNFFFRPVFLYLIFNCGIEEPFI